MSAYLITHSLLSSWLRSLREDPYEDATTARDTKAEFMKVLRREPTEQTDAMLNGIAFENLVTEICAFEPHEQTSLIGNAPRPEDFLPESVRKNPWFDSAFRVAKFVQGGQLQHVATKRVTVDGMELLLYGRLDALRAGNIFDIKFSKSYDRGKYIDSTQHPMYLELVPEAGAFTYLVSNGTELWTEKYRRDETHSIYPIIRNFLQYLSAVGLMDLYREYWGERAA